MIYQLLPAVCKLLPAQPDQAIIVVLSPLKALIQNQIEEANCYSKTLNLNACSLDGSYQQICAGHYNLIIDTPEAWLKGNNCWKDVLSSQHFRKNVKCFVLDEAHKVSWGTPSSLDGEIFREAFSRIGEVRSFCTEGIPVLALSATVDRDYTELITASCSLSSSLKFVYTCSDRPNIRLSFVKIKQKDVSCFSWVFDLLISKGFHCPKVLIYGYSQELVGWLYEQFLVKLEKNAYKDSIKLHENKLIAMYHADTLDHNKENVMDSLTRETGNVRVVIATSALGCGVNCKNLSFVLHFGPSHGLVEYCQQIGRVGRSGEELSHAVLYAYPQISSIISKEMKQYIKDGNDSCLRTRLFTPFNENNAKVPSITPHHRCCSSCSANCICGSENCTKVYFFEKNSDEEPEVEFNVIVREVSEHCLCLHQNESSRFRIQSGSQNGFCYQTCCGKFNF